MNSGRHHRAPSVSSDTRGGVGDKMETPQCASRMHWQPSSDEKYTVQRVHGVVPILFEPEGNMLVIRSTKSLIIPRIL